MSDIPQENPEGTPPAETPKPKAIIEVTWDPEKQSMDFSTMCNPEPGADPAAHFGHWFANNSGVLTALAAREWNLLQEFARERAHTAIPVPVMPGTNEPDPQEQGAGIIHGTPRLIGPNGGPLN